MISPINPASYGVVMNLGIGKLAQLAGVGVDTIRYYERNGLLSPRGRLASGYRRYGGDEVTRLRFIRRAQKLGFTLKEIGALLRLSAGRNVAHIRQAAAEKLADVEVRIADLQRVRAGLATLVEACPGHGRPADCPIVRALSYDADGAAADPAPDNY